MSRCFLCGNIDEVNAELIGFHTFTETLYSFLKKENVKTVYTCNRNLFDDMCEDAINVCLDGLDLCLMKVSEVDERNIFYHQRTVQNHTYGQVIMPFEEELNSFNKFTLLYDWMAKRSDFMITFMIDDGDISFYLKKAAEENGVKIFNIAEQLPSRIVLFDDSVNDKDPF